MFHFCTAHFQRKTMMNRGLDSDLHTKEISLKKLYLDIYYVCIYIWIGESNIIFFFTKKGLMQALTELCQKQL